MHAITPCPSGKIAQLKQQVSDFLKKNTDSVSQAEIQVSMHSGFSVTARKGQAESVEHYQGGALNLSVYIGNRTGSASSTDFTPDALKAAFQKAMSIAQFTGDDPCSGLAEPDVMAHDYPELDLNHMWAISPEEGIEIARECEATALVADKRILHSEGATLGTYQTHRIYANTHGFMGDYAKTYHSLNCTLVAQENEQMQTEGDYTCARDPKDLLSAHQVAVSAAERTLQRLGAKRLTTRRCPILFSPEMARGFFSQFLSAISGRLLYQQASFLLNHLEKPVFPSHINISENPYLPKGMGSTPFDAEGGRVQLRDLVHEGVLKGYLLGSYSARRLGMRSTGNAGGAHNVIVSAGDQNFTTLLKTMNTGLWVTQLLGQGVNLLTGDYSRGVFGYWVENGEIQHPVHEVTIAGNLKEMFLNIIAVSNDIDKRGSVQTGSVLIDHMTVAGE